MVEIIDIDRDSRNRRGAGGDPKKRLNTKESIKRASQIMKRANQRNGGGGFNNSEEIKQEFDEINKEYLKKIERQKKLAAEIKRNEEKKQEFVKDFISLVIGPEPKNLKRKVEYEKTLEHLTCPKIKAHNHISDSQRAALLDYLKKSFN